ncbi:hypothetical protein K504DRAFT_387404 [Pleomassaria siparia CBS 279.74]|uniref:Altered inheritance of mitochondria protein 6 n=1 Tax=Pleomassaria siparia CBS 279.74 TaxID=1314801 RepID=A0A6G1K0C7_9PLEO|nr:hypothetical protein K504DRAFT_387404 [Pleomassaria siparia CBS 279.74]
MARTDFDTSDLDIPLKDAPIVSLRALENGHDFENVDLSARRAFWRRALSMLRRGNGGSKQRQGREMPRFPGEGKDRLHWRRRKWSRWLKGSRLCLLVSGLIIAFFGIVHMVNVSMLYIPLLWDDTWGQSTQISSDLSTYPEDITRGVVPINCHSHNDYWRKIPLYEALRYGCTGVEADVWLFSEELFVGHSTHALTQTQTFRSMYVDPLVTLLDKQNARNDLISTVPPRERKSGIFDMDPLQTLVLLVDFKNNGTDIFPVLSEQIVAFREKGYLTYFDGKSTVPGPITIVATGNAPFDLITKNETYRDIFFDAPLDRMYQAPANAHSTISNTIEDPPPRTSGQGTVGVSETSSFDYSNSFYASVSFKKSIGFLWGGRISTSQLELIRGQIRGAKARGLKPRYWGTPNWPVGLRNRVWKTLVEEGVEYLNGDDLAGMTRGDWGVRKHWGWLKKT